MEHMHILDYEPLSVNKVLVLKYDAKIMQNKL